MAENVESLIDIVCDHIFKYLDTSRIAAAKQRMTGILARQDVDFIPMVTIPKLLPQLQDLPQFNWAQQWNNPAESLYMQLKDIVLPAIAGGGDYVPSVRADTGVINCMSLFGVGYAVPEHTKPVVTTYVTRERLRNFEFPQDISRTGIMPQMIMHMEHHLAALKKRGLEQNILVGHCDLQGPFDIAAMVRGHDIFTDFYEDPDFVHHLMQLSTTAYVAVAKLCKKITREPLNHGISDGIYMENGLGRMCGDSDILVSRDIHERFIRPYQAKAMEAFGGGWFHYCGGRPGFNRAEGLHLHASYAEIPLLRGLNWTTAGDLLVEMRRMKELGVVYIGNISRPPGQPLEDYFRMVLNPYDKRADFIFGWPEIQENEINVAMDIWHKLQDVLLA